VTTLRYPDDGLAALWSDDRMPYVSPHTERGPYRGVALRDALERALVEARPSLIVVPDPRDVHAEHAAAGRFAFVALAHASLPSTMLTYFVHDPLWPPAPASGPIMPPPPDRDLDGTVWISLALTPAEQETKARALRAHRSQWPVLGGLLERFVRANEIFAVESTTHEAGDAIERH
jgi:LmbE family N-acetylglucosaminyl deacetylase